MNTFTPLNDNVVIKVSRDKDSAENTMVTLSGIHLPASSDDWLEGEVVSKGPGLVEDDGKTFHSTAHLEIGMKVLFEKEFHHVYDARRRDRIDHTRLLGSDDDFNYYLTVADDVKLQIINKNDYLGFMGELYPTLAQKTVLRK